MQLLPLGFGKQQAGRLIALQITGTVSQRGKERKNAFSALHMNIPKCISAYYGQSQARTSSLFSS